MNVSLGFLGGEMLAAFPTHSYIPTSIHNPILTSSSLWGIEDYHSYGFFFFFFRRKKSWLHPHSHISKFSGDGDFFI